MPSHVDVSFVKNFTPPGPTRRLSAGAEQDILRAITKALGQGYDGVNVVWNHNKAGTAFVNPIKVGKGVRCG